MPEENLSASPRKRRHLCLLAALAVLAAVLLAACGGGDSDTGGGSTEAANTETASGGGGGGGDKEVIDLTFLTASTGGCGPIDEENALGLEIAAEKRNEEPIEIGGTEYELAFHKADTKGENTEGINVVRQELAAGEKFFLGTICSIPAQPGVGALFEQATDKAISISGFGSPAIAPADKAAEEAVEGPAKNLFAGTLPAEAQGVRDSYEMQLFPEVPKKVYILMQNDEGGEVIANGFEKGLDKQGIEHEKALYDPTTKDFSGFLAKVKAYDPDVLVSGYFPEPALAVLKQMLQTKAARGYFGFGQPIEDALKTAIGKPIPVPAVWDQYPVSLLYSPNPAVKQLKKDIEEKTGEGLGPNASYAATQYDFVGMLVAAMEKAESVDDVDAIGKALGEIEYDSGWFGPLKFDATHHVPTTTDGCYIKPLGEVQPCKAVGIDGVVEG